MKRMADPHGATVTVVEYFLWFNSLAVNPTPPVMQMAGDPIGGAWSIGNQQDSQGQTGDWFSINATSGLVSALADPSSPFVFENVHNIEVLYSVPQPHGKPLAGGLGVEVITQ
jgi:hypothetical protein